MLLRTLNNRKLLRNFCRKPNKAPKVFGFSKGKKNAEQTNKEESITGVLGAKVQATGEKKEKLDLSKVKMFNFNKLNVDEDKLTPLSLKFEYKNREKKQKESKLVQTEIVARIAKEVKKEDFDVEKLFEELTTKQVSRSQVVASMIFWVHSSQGNLTQEDLCSYLDAIQDSDLVTLDAPILSQFNSLMKAALSREEHLERSQNLIDQGAAFDEISIQIVFEEFSNLVHKNEKLLDENEVYNIIKKLNYKLATFEKVFKNLASHQASGENEGRVAFFVKPSEIIEKLLDFKKIHFSVSKEVDDLISSFYQIYITSNILLNRNIDHLDFISERIVSEGFILRNSFIDFSKEEIALDN